MEARKDASGPDRDGIEVELESAGTPGIAERPEAATGIFWRE